MLQQLILSVALKEDEDDDDAASTTTTTRRMSSSNGKSKLHEILGDRTLHDLRWFLHRLGSILGC